MVTEQLVYFTGMTRTELSDFGGETLISLLYQLPLDGFFFFLVVVPLDHACKCFCSDLYLFFLLFLLLLVILFACTTRNSPYAVFIPYFCFLGT